MKRIKIVQFICVGGLLTALTVLFQSAPVFLPAIGLALSPFSTLPIAIASSINPILGAAVLFSSTILLVFVSTQEAMILLFTTGLLGLVLGALLLRKGVFVTILASTFALTVGIIIMTYIVVIPAFVEFADSFSLPIVLLFFAGFSLVYVSVWGICFRKLAIRFRKFTLLE